MKNYFPKQNDVYKYIQTNTSDRLGSLWSSFNLDLQSNLGQLRLANKLVTNTTSSDDADLGLPVAFEFWSGLWWAICGQKLFKTSTKELTGGFTEETGIGWTIGLNATQFDITNPAGTTYRYTFDGTGTNPNITATSIPIGASVVITGTNFAAGNNGTFTVTGSGTNYFEVTNAGGAVESNKTIGTGSIAVIGGTQGNFSTVVSDMKVFNDKLWVTNNNTGLFSRNTAGGNWTEIDSFSSLFVPHQMAYFKKFDRLYYIADSTSIRSVDTSSVVDSSTTYYLNAGYSPGWLSGMVASSSYIWISYLSDNVESDASASKLQGGILQWDGVSQQVVNEFPVNASSVLAMTVLNDVPYAIDSYGRILGFTGSSFKEITRLPLDKSILANSNSAQVNKWIHFNGFVATENDTLLILVNNLNNDGTVNENLPSGIWELDLKTSNLTHKHSATLKSKDSSTVTDYGQNKVSAVGALKINTLESSSSLGRSELLAGLSYYDATTTKSAIFIESPFNPTTDLEGQKRGYFVTTWFESNEIEDNWQRVWTVFKKFLNSNDKIILKYRLEDEDPIEATITWISTTEFTTTTDISDYVNYECEILQGIGSGSCNVVSSVIPSTGIYTVVLDTAITGATGTGKVRFQKWIKLLPEITGQTVSYGQCSITKNNSRIQIKGILEWTGDNEFHKMILVSNEHIKINP